jgi:hypothetical protein
MDVALAEGDFLAMSESTAENIPNAERGQPRVCCLKIFRTLLRARAVRVTTLSPARRVSGARD